MGKVKVFCVTINTDPATIPPAVPGGLCVSGSIVIKLKKPVQVKYLNVQLHGESKCKWNEGSKGNARIYSSIDVLIDLEQELIRSDESSPYVLNQGSHKVPFVFQVQADRHLPSSYACGQYGYGRIVYSLSARMSQFGAICHEKASLIIQVSNPVPLNMALHEQPAVAEDSHTDCCLCCTSGPVIVTANINKSGLAIGSGETLKVELSVDNMKGMEITPKVCLIQMTKFRAQRNYKTLTKAISAEKQLGQPIMPKTRHNRSSYVIGPIPPTVCGNINSTNNILVSYMVTMKGSRFKLLHPIFLGTGQTPYPNSQFRGLSSEPEEDPDVPPMDYDSAMFAPSHPGQPAAVKY
ncbi:arrestin domain-containing protein 3-like isoform X2 [Watersipora subatra]|uniref:arrestin domain-containing protein 3-like isoform X2 n=1 Tax=Watersipora subatra TaxID=2589382 RepID=UPI00355C0A17